jgi:hypothetical protein
MKPGAAQAVALAALAVCVGLAGAALGLVGRVRGLRAVAGLCSVVVAPLPEWPSVVLVAVASRWAVSSAWSVRSTPPLATGSASRCATPRVWVVARCALLGLVGRLRNRPLELAPPYRVRVRKLRVVRFSW